MGPYIVRHYRRCLQCGVVATIKLTTRPRASWPRADAETRRNLIVDVAISLLQKHGLKGVTMRRIAERLGVGAMTLYTYFDSREVLRQAMTQRGFERLAGGCEVASTLGTEQGWRGGARFYLEFALDNPALYKLMFATQIESGEADVQILHRGFQPLVDRVREQMAKRGMAQDDLDRNALTAAGQFWISLHGLASLAIVGRLSVLNADLDDLLDGLLSRVAPT